MPIMVPHAFMCALAYIHPPGFQFKRSILEDDLGWRIAFCTSGPHRQAEQKPFAAHIVSKAGSFSRWLVNEATTGFSVNAVDTWSFPAGRSSTVRAAGVFACIAWIANANERLRGVCRSG